MVIQPPSMHGNKGGLWETSSYEIPAPPVVAAAPDPLSSAGPSSTLDHRALAQALANAQDNQDEITATTTSTSTRGQPHPDLIYELRPVRSGQTYDASPPVGLPEEQGSPVHRITQGVPPELPSLFAEIIFVLVVAAGQVINSLTIGHILVNQVEFTSALGIQASQLPWLNGASALACGLSVIIFGPFADLIAPKPLMVGAFLWEALWNGVSAATVSPEWKILWLVSRAMQGLAVGVLVSTPMSILGRVYSPGIRKTRVFSLMAAGAPVGFWLGCVQGGALSAHLRWIFGSTALFLALCAVAAQLTIPNLQPARDSSSLDAPSIRQFDYLGAILASLGCGLFLFGLTQGSAAHWSPYTYSTIIAGVVMLGLFVVVERRVARPLVPNQLFKTPGFAALLASYCFGMMCYIGAWQFYAIQFWQRYQGASPMTTALYLLPNAIIGVLAAWLVSKLLHVVPNHWIFAVSMLCFGLGPVFFLPQKESSSYWALSMPGVALASFGPDLSFAAASIFITSSVPRSYQGSAGSLLLTVQSLTFAIAASVATSIGIKVDLLPSGEVGLDGMRVIWWFGLGCALVGAVITLAFIRIPKAEEKEHVQ